MFGFININKPSGMASHKVISVLRKITGIKQIGHAGTLDPVASGVLPVAIGKASKLIDYLPQDKSYIAGMYLGFESDTYDTEGIVKKLEVNKVSQEDIEKALKNFRGEILQIPPAFSAVHYNGKRLYQLARAGNIPENIPSRKITVYKNEIIGFDFEKQILMLEISCSKGTYIRSLVNDLGKALNTGAVMFSLQRTVSSGMNIENSVDIKKELSKQDIENSLIKPQDILPLKSIEVNEDEYKLILNGNKFENKYKQNGEILLIKNGIVIALAIAGNDYIQPKKVLI